MQASNKAQALSRSAAVTLLIGTSILWSFGGLLIKWVSWNPIAIAGMRSAIAAVLLLLVIRRPRFDWSATQLSCAAAYAGTVILFVIANKLTTAANAILLQYTAPIYVAVLGAWFLKEKARLVDWLCIFFTLGGMVLFFLDELTTGGLLGNIIAIVSGICFASMIVLMRKQKAGSPIESVLLGNIATALICAPFMFGSMPDRSSWIGLSLLGILQLGLSYILYSKAIKHVTALEGVLIPVLEPVLNPLWVLLLLGEKPGPWSIAGGFIVLVSVTARYVFPILQGFVKN